MTAPGPTCPRSHCCDGIGEHEATSPGGVKWYRCPVCDHSYPEGPEPPAPGPVPVVEWREPNDYGGAPVDVAAAGAVELRARMIGAGVAPEAVAVLVAADDPEAVAVVLTVGKPGGPVVRLSVQELET